MAVVLLALQFAAGAPGVLAAATCTFNAATHVATATADSGGLPDEPLVVERQPNGDAVLFGTTSPTPCGSATVTTLNLMNIDMAGSHQALDFTLGTGPLAPSFSNSTGEIEFNVTNVGNSAGVGVFGTSGDDSFTTGQGITPPGGLPTEDINFNAAAEGSNPDFEVAIHGLVAQISLVGSDGNDQLLATGTGTFGSHTLEVPAYFDDGSGADTMVGGNGNDTWQSFHPNDQGDSFQGGAGLDTVNLQTWTGNLSITLDDQPNDGAGCPGQGCQGDNIHSDIEVIETGSGNDTIVAGAGHQVLEPGLGHNVLFGGGGPDTVISDAGTDEVHGGPGFDSMSFERVNCVCQGGLDGVTVTLDGIANDGFSGEGDNIEPDVEAVYGTSGSDQISGDPGPNRLYGGPGNDVLSGQGGNDLLDGGGGLLFPAQPEDGSDTFIGGPGIDTVVEDGHTAGMTLSIDGAPNDVVNGDPAQGTDDISTDVENVFGGPFDDTITGSPGANRLVGGGGSDVLNGGGGNDVLVPGPGNDTLVGGPGQDTVSFAGAAAAITASLDQGSATGDGTDALQSVESLLGSSLGDSLTGSPGANVLKGAGGDDVLKGLAGNDVLLGGPGNDSLDGGAGIDTCKQGPGTGSVTGCEH